MSFPRLLREPLVHFFALAALFFAVNELVSSAGKPAIVVDAETAEFLIRQREDLELRTLSSEERAGVIDAWVEDEILYREAYARGLDRGDGRMRRNLILKMRSLLTGDLGAPTEAELAAFFDARKDHYARPATLSLEQVFFEDSARVPADLLERLTGGLDPALAGVDSSVFRRTMPNMTRRMMVATFGPEVARRILAIGDDAWHGPFTSPLGVHFLRVAARHPGVDVDYEAVKHYVEGDWLMEQSRAAIRAEVERLKRDYDVVVETES